MTHVLAANFTHGLRFEPGRTYQWQVEADGVIAESYPLYVTTGWKGRECSFPRGENYEPCGHECEQRGGEDDDASREEGRL